MKLRWIISILISLILHTALLYGMYYQQSQKPAPPIPMEVAIATEQPSLRQPEEIVSKEPLRQPQETDKSETEVAEENLKFRPVEQQNAEQNQPDPKPELEPELELGPDKNNSDVQEIESSKIPAPDQKPAESQNKPEETPLTDSEYRHQIEQYRNQIIGDFQENWQKIPELNTRIPHPSMVSDIDSHFKITIIAYGFVDHRPAPPFLIFDPKTQTYAKVDEFDFSRYSNRVKDRSFDPDCRRALEKARREFGIKSLMKIIGLVPIETDRYFAAKQYQAVQSSGVPLEQVALTAGHYEPNKAGGFSLIIDSITTIENRTIAINDKEKNYSR